jgi:hypothetical protein
MLELTIFLASKDLEERGFFIILLFFGCGMAGRRIPWMVGRHTNKQNNNQIPEFQLWLVIQSPSCLHPSGKHQSLLERFWKECLGEGRGGQGRRRFCTGLQLGKGLTVSVHSWALGHVCAW